MPVHIAAHLQRFAEQLAHLADCGDAILFQGSPGAGHRRGRLRSAAVGGDRTLPGVAAHDQALAPPAAGARPSRRFTADGSAGPPDGSAPRGLAAPARGAAGCHAGGALRPLGRGPRVQVSTATMSRVITGHFGWTRKKVGGGQRAGRGRARGQCRGQPAFAQGGMDPATCSGEQRAGRITRYKTDLWPRTGP